MKEETGERRNARGERLKLEKRKMDMAIFSLFLEMGEEREIEVLGVFHDKETALFYQPFFHNEFRYFGRVEKVVWGVGKNKVELLLHRL